ncbi:MAG: hypothetical protein AB7R77_15485 [Ilumatobacteraceae bacterium]
MKIRTTNIRRLSLRFLAVAALVTAAFGVQTALTAGPSAPSSVVTMDPARILDTREPLGVPAKAPVGANSTITVQVAGVQGVPMNATGVIVTLTAVDATVPTFITATPTGTPRGTTSVLNPGSPLAIANTVTMALGSGGQIDLYNLAGSVNLIADVSGYLLPSGASSIVTESIELQAYNGMGISTGAPDSLGCVDLAETGELFLDVPLPHGAAVQSVTFRWFDNDTANFTFIISEVDGNFAGAPTSGNLVGSQGQTTGAVGYGSTTLNITGGDAVSGSVRYYIDAFTLGQVSGGTFHRFCGATVTYQRVVS